MRLPPADHDNLTPTDLGTSVNQSWRTTNMRKLLIALLLLAIAVPIATGGIGCRAEGEVGDAD